MKIFDVNIFVEVKRSITAEEAIEKATAAITCAVLFGILFFAAIIVMVIYIYLYYKIKKTGYESANEPEV